VLWHCTGRKFGLYLSGRVTSGQVGFLNIISLETADSCIDYASAVQKQITDQFGGSALVEQGLLTSTIVGRHIVKLPSNATSTQTNGMVQNDDRSWAGRLKDPKKYDWRPL
jgi:hypothetical protein